MAGKIRQMIDLILEQKAKDNPMLVRVIKTKMILKGIDPARYTEQSEDDPAVLAQLQSLAEIFGGASKTAAPPTPAQPAVAQSAPAPSAAAQPAAAPPTPAAPAAFESKNAVIKSAFSSKPSTQECVAEIQSQLAEVEPVLVVFFASAKHAPATVSARMQAAFPDAQVFGCSTAGEIVSGHMLVDSIVAMAFSSDAAGASKVEVVRDLGDRAAIEKAFNGFEAHFGEPVAAMDPSRYVGIVLVDGMSGAEEGLMETLGDLTNVTFIGGSAGDDLKFARTQVYAHGKSHSRSAVLVLLRPGVRFSFVKTQSFQSLQKSLKATRVNEAKREVLEFNDRPAAQAYAEAVGVPVGEANDRFMRNPVGLFVEGEPYVRSPQLIDGDSMVFYCGVKEGMELELLKSTDIICDTRSAIAQAKQDLGGISAIIDFDCILRTLDLRQNSLCDDYGKVFSDIPTVGFSTYGEQYLGHINQTATMLVFG